MRSLSKSLKDYDFCLVAYTDNQKEYTVEMKYKRKKKKKISQSTLYTTIDILQ
jgi:hypothetical protein